jgi:hypothetical protein
MQKAAVIVSLTLSNRAAPLMDEKKVLLWA